MERKTLEELGLDKETIDKIMDANGKDIEREKQKAAQAEKDRDAYKGQVAERDKQLEELKKSPPADADALKEQIVSLQKANSDARKAHEAALAQVKLDSALEMALAGAKVRNSKAARALLDSEKIKLDGDNLVGLDEQLEALRKDADYLFEPAAPSTPDVKGFKPAGAGPEGGQQDPNAWKPEGAQIVEGRTLSPMFKAYG